MEEYRFRQGFLWGGACSGPQCEGVFPGDGNRTAYGNNGIGKIPMHFTSR